MAKKADAWKEYQEAAMVDMMLEVMPKVAAEVAAPLTKTNKITMVADSNGEIGASKLTAEASARQLHVIATQSSSQHSLSLSIYTSSTGVKLILRSKGQCLFSFWNYTTEGRGGEKGGECKYKNKEHRTFDPKITLSPVVKTLKVKLHLALR